MVTWNARMDLTAAKSGEELVELMVTDALVLASAIAENARVVDVGTGAGAPGLALAIVRPDLKLTLVDSLGKRMAFLRTILGRLRRADVTLVTGRGESLAEGSFDVAISRATLAPEAWEALGKRLVRSGGEVWVLLGEEASPRPGAHEYVWPVSGRRRSAYAVSRSSP